MTTAALRIANAEGIPGTVCALVHGEEGMPLALTNHHVVFGGGAMAGDRVWALGEDGEMEHLGHGLRGQIGRVTCGGQTHFVDCAVVGLRARRLLPAWLNAALDSLPRATALARPGLVVEKLGPATGRTRGVIATVDHFDAPHIHGCAYQAPRQLLVDSADPELMFCAAGDSGAALVDERDRIVGLLWGCTGVSQGIASPIEAVLEALAVTFD
jgi:hypothetical protein